MTSTFQQAQTFHQKKDYQKAIVLYQQVIRETPKFPESYHFLGILYSQQGQHEKGIQSVLKAIELNPIHPPFYNNLGLMYQKTGSYKNSIEVFKAATRLAADFAQPWFNMANSYKSLKETEAAKKYYKKTLKVAPNFAQAAYNLGNLLLEEGKAKSAQEWFEKAIKLVPDYAEAHNNLGSSFEVFGETQQAMEHFKKAAQLKPNFPDALKNISQNYSKQGEYQKARTHFQQYLQLIPPTPYSALQLQNISPIIFENNAAIDAYRKELISVLENLKLSELPLDQLHELNIEPPANLNYQGRNNLKIKQLYGHLFNDLIPKLVPKNKVKNPIPKVGFVVTSGHEGVFIKCMRGILNQFDTTKFQVTIICSAPHGATILKPVITNSNINFLSLPKNIKQAAEKIAANGFDILHYWEIGTDAMNYFLPFFRPAPIQCGTWGWPSTSGIPEMDYFISSTGLEIADAEAHYSEKIVRLKHLPTYYYKPPIPKKLTALNKIGLPSNQAIYLVAQNLRKVHPDFDAIVKGILEKDPVGVLVFIEDSQKNVSQLLKNRLSKLGNDLSNRIIFLKRMAEADYLNLVTQVDVILDTVHYTGGANTAYDAIATGTPYVTLPGTLHQSRYGFAAYQQIGVMDIIAQDQGDFIEKAVKIAKDKDYQAALRQRIQSNAHKVFEDEKAVRELECFFSSIPPG